MAAEPWREEYLRGVQERAASRALEPAQAVIAAARRAALHQGYPQQRESLEELRSAIDRYDGGGLVSITQAGLRPGAYLTLQQQYEEWRRSPDGEAVFRACHGAAIRLLERGFRRYGIKALYEAARYDAALKVGPDADGWRLNNSWTSRLARELIDYEPRLVDFFELRELRA